MTKVAIVGGKLQGTEAVFLAKKAGYKSILIDKDHRTPASGLCDEMGIFDVRRKEKALIDLLKKADFVLPALEAEGALTALVEISIEHGLKLAFDPRAYSITSSKLKSDAFMKEHGLPIPEYFPEWQGSYIIKPSGGSGSAGVIRAESPEEVRRFLQKTENPDAWVAQEYLEGRAYSIEIIGFPGMYRTYGITEIHVADDYDCKMVTTPWDISEALKTEFSDIAYTIGEAMGLRGIMDVEAIESNGRLKVLEIDARFPSQTPIVVFYSTGVNLLSELAGIMLNGKHNEKSERIRRYASIEHFLIDDSGVHSMGEGIMNDGGSLFLKENFFGADTAITDFDGKKLTWRGTFINTAGTEEEMALRRRKMLQALEAAKER